MLPALRSFARDLIARLRPPSRQDWIFAVRTTATGLAALYLSLALGLNEPQWSIMTVFIVAQPFAGMVLAKGFYRVIGSLIGAAAAIVLVHLLAPWPAVFLVAMAAWLGLCTFVSGLLRNVASYGAVLAGYTAGIIAYPALDAPHLLGELAVGRCSEIMLGIVCAGLTSAAVLPQRIRPALQSRLRTFLLDVAGYAAQALEGAAPAALHVRQRRLIVDSQALDLLRAYGLAEAPGLRTRSRQVRHLLGHLLAAISTARMLHAHLGSADPPAHRLLQQAAAALRRIATAPDGLDPAGAGRASLAELESGISAQRRAHHASPAQARQLGAAAMLIGLGELIDAMMHAIAGFGALLASGERPPPPSVAGFAVHRDFGAASRNAARAAIAATLIGLLWRATDWPEGAGLVAIVGALTGLFSALPAPVQMVMTFFRGSLYAVPVVFVVGQLILPHMPGFAPLALVLGPVLVAAGLAMARPQTLAIATGFVVMFLAMLSPRPVMAADLAGFLDITAAVLGGIVLCALAFKLILPPRPAHEIAQLGVAMRDDLRRLCNGRTVPGRLEFESRMYDRMNRVLERLDAAGGNAEAALASSTSALTIGIEILRLRSQRAVPPLSQGRRHLLDCTLARLAEAFEGTASQAAQDQVVACLGSAALRLMQSEGAAPAGHPAQAAALRIIATAMADRPGCFITDGGGG